jgi:hypothetical protein
VSASKLHRVSPARIVGGISKEDELDLGGENSDEDDPDHAVDVYSQLEEAIENKHRDFQ